MKTIKLNMVYQNAAVVFFIGVLLLSCQNHDGASGTTNQSQQLKTYKHSEDGKPNSLDPIKSSSVYSSMLVVNIFDTLYSYKYLKRPYELKPNLAKSMPQISDDGLTYLIQIKEGVYFSDHKSFKGGKGRLVTADDFIYSIKRTFDPLNNGTGNWLWQSKIQGLDEWQTNGAKYEEPISGLTAIDDFTIQIKLTMPYPQLVHTFAMAYSAIVPQEVVEFYGPAFGSNPVGSGPFILDDFSTDVAYLSKNKNHRSEPVDIYFEGFNQQLHQGLGLETIQKRSPPFIDKLEVHFVKESSSRWLSFNKDDEIQYTTLPKERQQEAILGINPLTLKTSLTDKFHSSFDTEAGFVYHGFNMLDPDFGDSKDKETQKRNKALRCAIRKAHDWNQKNHAFYFGLGTVFPGVIPPNQAEYDANISLDSVTLDVEGAKDLLNRNNWDDSNLPVFEYHTYSSVLQKQFFGQMRGFLNAISYPTEKIKYHPHASFGHFNQAIKNRQAPFFFMGWTFDYPDAENVFQLFYGPNQTPGTNNFNYHNEEYDKLYEKSRTMPQSPERTAIYRKMNQIIIDECVVISGLARKKINLWHKNVVTYPDREVVGGFHLKYVDIKQPLKD